MQKNSHTKSMNLWLNHKSKKIHNSFDIFSGCLSWVVLARVPSSTRWNGAYALVDQLTRDIVSHNWRMWGWRVKVVSERGLNIFVFIFKCWVMALAVSAESCLDSKCSIMALAVSAESSLTVSAESCLGSKCWVMPWQAWCSGSNLNSGYRT